MAIISATRLEIFDGGDRIRVKWQVWTVLLQRCHRYENGIFFFEIFADIYISQLP